MQIALRTLLAIITLVTTVLAKSITPTIPTLTQTATSAADMPEQEDYMTDELEKFKQLMKSRAPSINSLSQLNVTLEAKRKFLRQYREKLQELNQLDMQTEESIHQRDLYSYQAITDDHSEVGVYKFPVNIPQPENYRLETRVQKATITLHRRDNLSSIDLVDNQRRNVGHNTVIMVYQTLPGHMRRLITSAVISLARSEPIQIDITEIAQSWLDEPALNLGVEIECATHNISQIILPAHTDQNNDNGGERATEIKPTLDIYTYERTINTAHRQRRNADEDACEPGKCCRHPVTILLSDIGHHIEGFHEEGANMTAYLCSGRCPRNYKLHNKWSNLKNVMRIKDRDSQLRNRCAPTEYQKITVLLHFDYENESIAFKEYDDVIVKECGCV